MKVIGVIPARYKSTRFEGKPLADIQGKPMIWWTYKQAKKVKEIDEVYVATDDERIVEVCKKYNIKYIITSSMHKTSTERLFEVANSIKSDFYICINGDEPLINPSVIKQIIPKNIENIDMNNVYVANLMTKMKNPVEVVDNTNIKVVVNNDNKAIYMSRSPIPNPKASMNFVYKKHLGVLIYNYKALEFFSKSPKGLNESIEDINELRFIENGNLIEMIEVLSESLSVDTPKDLQYIDSILEEKLKKGENIYE